MIYLRVMRFALAALIASWAAFALAATPPTQSGGESKTHAASTIIDDPSAITSILMHRSGCYGFCPIYEVEVNRKGDVVFTGHGFVEKVGKHNAQVAPSKFLQLAALVEHINFFQLNEQYRYKQDGCTEWWSDSPTVDIIVTRGSQRKHVSYYYGCEGPPVAKQIDALSKSIDKVTNSKVWIGKGGPPPAP